MHDNVWSVSMQLVIGIGPFVPGSLKKESNYPSAVFTKFDGQGWGLCLASLVALRRGTLISWFWCGHMTLPYLLGIIAHIKLRIRMMPH